MREVLCIVIIILTILLVRTANKGLDTHQLLMAKSLEVTELQEQIANLKEGKLVLKQRAKAAEMLLASKQALCKR